MFMKKGLTLCLVLALAAGLVFAGGGGQSGSTEKGSAVPPSGTLPRNETVYFNGILWAAVTQFNPYGTGGISFGITPPTDQVARQIIYETLFLYNMLDGKMYPHIGETYAWNGMTLTVTLRKDVRFNNGVPLKAEDVVHSFALSKEYQTSGSGIWVYLDSITAKDDYTVEFKANPNRYNPGQILDSLCSRYITSKAEWDRILKETDPQRGTAQSNRMAVAQYPNLQPVATGPYKPMVWDETKCVLIRDDNYWGKTKYGKLPAPKYVVHNVYKDNAAGDAAFRAGEVDISQQFISQVWRMWEGGAKVETFIPQAPYYFPGVIPTLVFNSKRPGLSEAVVRRAIALSLDYPTMGNNAASGYTAPVTASYMLPVPSEQGLIDWDALKPYQWSSDRVARLTQANRDLDAAGWARGADGIRAKGGVKLSFVAECPTGWSDFQATLEVAAQSAKDVGIDIKTSFPQQPVWQDHKDNTNFDIVLHNYGGVGPSAPWGRYNLAMGSSAMPPDGVPNNVQNWGRWVNKEVNDLLDQAAKETDQAKLKQLYTRINIIYLQEMPVAVAWYRPLRFHTVNTSVWEGYPKLNDGSNLPPTLCIDGYGFLSLFNLKAKGR
jgi:peptide/nickel transport system substrate-binding protein